MRLFQLFNYELKELDWKKNKWAILFGVIAISPAIGAIPNTQPLYYATMALMVCVLFFYTSRISLEMLGFLMACCLSIICAHPSDIFQSWMRLGLFILVAFSASPLLQSTRLCEFRLVVLTTMIKLCVIISVLSFFCYFLGINFMTDTYDIGYQNKTSLFGGLTRQSMLLGPMSGVAMIYCGYRGLLTKSYWYWIAVVFCGACLLFTSSRSAFLASIVGLLLCLYHLSPTKTKFIKIVLRVAVVGTIIFTLWDTPIEGLISKHTGNVEMGSATASRDAKWENRLSEFYSSPIWGVGFAACNPNYIDDYSPHSGTVEPGSSWLAVLSMTGLLGFVAFCVIMSRALVRVWRCKLKEASLYIGILTFICLHMLAEGYIVAGGSQLCVIAWLIISCCYDLRCS